MFAVVVLLAMVVSGDVPAMVLMMAVVGASLERMVSSITVIVAMTVLVSLVVISVVLPMSDAPDCSGIVVVEMVVPLDGFRFFGCFDFVIVSTVEAQLWWLLLLLFVSFFVVADDLVVCGENHLFLGIIVMYVLVISLFYIHRN